MGATGENGEEVKRVVDFCFTVQNDDMQVMSAIQLVFLSIRGLFLFL